MSRVFVDASGVLALLVETDESHPAARRAFSGLQAEGAALVSSSYVLVETYALLGRRFELDIVRSFREDFCPLLEVIWVDEAIHERALDLLLERGECDLSLVDATSFIIARDRRIHRAFAFDRHFAEQGFDLAR